MTGAVAARLDEDLARHLVASCHPQRLAMALDPCLDGAVLERLRQSARLRRRIAALIVGEGATLAEPEGAAPAGASWIEDRSAGDLALAIGAAWHARALRASIARDAVAELVRRIGERTYAFALRNADLALPNLPPLASPEALAAAIARDGEIGLGAWLRGRPAAERWSLLVQTPPGSPVEAGPFPDGAAERAAAVIDRLRDEARSGEERTDDAA